MIGLCVVLAPISLATRNTNLAPIVVDVHGSLRNGSATILGGYRLSWLTGVKVLWLPHLATEFVLEGADTRITGIVKTGAQGIALSNASGRAGPGLAGMVPGAWACDVTARVNDVSFNWGWRSASGSGDVTIPQGSCSKEGREITLPPLALSLNDIGRDAMVTLTSDATPLATVLVRRERQLDIAIQPAAANVFPQLPRGGPITLQLPF